MANPKHLAEGRIVNKIDDIEDSIEHGKTQVSLWLNQNRYPNGWTHVNIHYSDDVYPLVHLPEEEITFICSVSGDLAIRVFNKRTLDINWFSVLLEKDHQGLTLYRFELSRILSERLEKWIEEGIIKSGISMEC